MGDGTWLAEDSVVEDAPLEEAAAAVDIAAVGLDTLLEGAGPAVMAARGVCVDSYRSAIISAVWEERSAGLEN